MPGTEREGHLPPTVTVAGSEDACGGRSESPACRWRLCPTRCTRPPRPGTSSSRPRARQPPTRWRCPEPWGRRGWCHRCRLSAPRTRQCYWEPKQRCSGRLSLRRTPRGRVARREVRSRSTLAAESGHAELLGPGRVSAAGRPWKFPVLPVKIGTRRAPVKIAT